MSFSQEFKKWTTVFEKEVNMLRKLNLDSIRTARLDVLEVICSDNSELTNQVLQLNGKAQRFGLSEGDLKHTSARLRLFRTILIRRPKSLWYSPECGPWSMWNFLNLCKSLDLEEKIWEKHFQNVWQIALGVVLFRLQMSQGSHFHWEQPGGFDMFKFPALEEIQQCSHLCRFGLCRVGNLQDPKSHAPIRKRLQVLSTSGDLFHAIHGKFCNQDHEHQHVAGNTMWQGKSIPMTHFIYSI